MGKSIFNSLGSNYSLQFTWSSLFSPIFSSKKDVTNLEQYLSKEYDGLALGVYKGRDAIQLAMSVLLDPGSTVITQAFSCYAVEEGINRANMKAVYADIEKGTPNMSVKTLQLALDTYHDAKAVLVQHSLGVPADIIEIKKWCKKNGLLLIEDLAQAVGGKDNNDQPLGSFADAIIFSFGRDKIIDTVSGGAVVFKGLNKLQLSRLEQIKSKLQRLPMTIVLGDMAYPFFTFLIRSTHHLGLGKFTLGKILFTVFKKIGVLGSPIISKTTDVKLIHSSYAKLALSQFKQLNQNISHRKALAMKYVELLDNTENYGLKLLIDKDIVSRASNLRFSFLVDNSQIDKIILALKQSNIYISDRWYRQAVDCGSFACKTAYKEHSCKTAEALATTVINLPTHRYINEKIVKQICDVILKTLKK